MMDQISIPFLLFILVVLILVSAFFSAAEISMMAINRYRLNHLISKKHRMAMMVGKLLERPDRLLGTVLIGNTFANIAASSITTLIAAKLFGDLGVILCTFLLTLIILIISEAAPKTLAASYAQPVAFFSVVPLMVIMKIISPITFVVNTVSNFLLRLLRFYPHKHDTEKLSSEELRTVLYETGILIPQEHRDMLVHMLDIETVTVNDIMIPRQEVVGINLDDDWNDIIIQLRNSQYTRLPVYQDTLDNLLGILHLRSAIGLHLEQEQDGKEKLKQIIEPIYSIPEHTPLIKLLLNFRSQKCRIGIVVDEYGDIQGMATLEDILEEIVGEFTTDIAAQTSLIHPQTDGSYLIDGSINLRELNRDLNWQFPVDGPKTLSGFIVEYLEFIPQSAMCIKTTGYEIEIVKIQENMVKIARIIPLIN